MQGKWKRSTCSAGASNCVELAKWKKSSRTQGANNCVELAHIGKVRDSKNPGIALPVSLGALVLAVKSGRFDR